MPSSEAYPLRLPLEEAEIAAGARPPLVVARQAKPRLLQDPVHIVLRDPLLSEGVHGEQVGLVGDVTEAVLISSNANVGVGHVRGKCPHEEFQVQCTPNNAPCDAGTRLIPVELIDVAGLVPGAWEGKGLGNQFLDDIRQASALIHIVDASGGTDIEGNPVDIGTHDPMEDIKFLEHEIIRLIMMGMLHIVLI